MAMLYDQSRARSAGLRCAWLAGAFARFRGTLVQTPNLSADVERQMQNGLAETAIAAIELEHEGPLAGGTARIEQIVRDLTPDKLQSSTPLPQSDMPANRGEPKIAG